MCEQKLREIRESHVLELHKLAVHEIFPCAGHYRDATKKVTLGDRVLPEPAVVESLVREAVDAINSGEYGALDVQRAGYALWRINWIHPFAGGNGRTARAIAYAVLCMRAGAMLPGTPTVPTLISKRTDAYIAALRHADATLESTGVADIDQMTFLVLETSMIQMRSALQSAAS